MGQIDELSTLQNLQTETDDRAAALRDERDSLSEEIPKLKAAMIQDSSLDPATVLREIEEKSARLKIISMQLVHLESDRMRAAIDAARSPIETYERDLEEALNMEHRADEARAMAQSEYEAAARRVLKLRHDIETARRAVQAREIDLAQHLSRAKADLA